MATTLNYVLTLPSPLPHQASPALAAGGADTLAAALRDAHPEYRRRPAAPFRVMVARALGVALAGGGGGGGSVKADGPSSSSSSGATSSSSDGDAAAAVDGDAGGDVDPASDAAAAAALGGGEAGAIRVAPGGGVNTTLLASYASRPPPPPPPQTPVNGGTSSAPPPSRPAAKRARVGAPRGPPRGGPTARPSSTAAVTPSRPRAVRYADLGGVDTVLHSVRELVEYPLRHPEVFAWLGVPPPRGVLLHGPPGTGKTALAHAIATELGVPFFGVAAPELVAGVSGESEGKIRDLFAAAAAAAPSLIFIDEIDALAPKRDRDGAREMERRIVAQLLTCMDDLSAVGGEEEEGKGDDNSATPSESAAAAATAASTTTARHVIVMGATNRPDALDAALRRAGRFDREIALAIPTAAARAAILRVVTRRLRLGAAVDVDVLAGRTPGYVGADLEALAKEAAAVAATRAFEALEKTAAATAAAGDEAGTTTAAAMDTDSPTAAAAPPPPPRLGAGPLTPAELSTLAIEPTDFDAALGRVQPSVRREGFTTAPAATWEDVGALAAVRDALEYTITRPIRDPAPFAALGLAKPAGVLLHGPPGCGKTLLARAVAAESGANFVSVKGPELLSKYVGESEAAVRRLFARATAAAPCILFFDELDALAPRRGGGEGGSSDGGAAARVVNQLLTELDGLTPRGAVYVVAATNRPDMVDPALLRPGRLDKALYVPLPVAAERRAVMATLTRRTPLAPGTDPAALAASPACDGFSGADLVALVREASLAALKDAATAADAARAAGAPLPPPPTVCGRHFQAALASVVPSVSPRDARRYAAMARLGGERVVVEGEGREGGGVAAAEP